MDNEIVNKVLSGQASMQEAKSVARWFEHPQGSLELVERIDRDLNTEWDRYYARPRLAASARHWCYRVACALLIIVCTLAGGYSMLSRYMHSTPVSEQVAYAARGERTQVVLQDGTRIFLNNESQITFPSRFSWGERRIHLDGEAYFEVAKNKHRPFVVEMNNSFVTVLGTRFNARSYDNEPVRVTLDEGSVQFSAPNIADVMLKPGESLCYDHDVATVTKAPLQLAGAWRNHRIEMDKMPLADAIKILERNYDVTFAVHGDRCYRHSFTLSMDDKSLRDVLNRMDQVSPLKIKYDEARRQVDVY